MRIAIIAEVFPPKVDGVVIRTMNLIRGLREQGDEILVVCPQCAARTESSVPLREFPSFPFPAYPEYCVGLPDERLAQDLQDFAPDVLHYINPFAFGFRCCDILERAGVRLPSLFSFHTLYAEFAKRYPLMTPLSRALWWLMRDYHNTADRNLTVSSIMQQDLVDRGFQRVELWPPAVDCTLFDPRRFDPQMRERLSDGYPERPLLLTVSRLAPEKNVGFLADVIRQVPGARLAVVGDGPARADLERQFAGTPTTFIGYLKGTELAAAYASADAFVYASETETMGNVVLEAMASGLCVIAPRAGGIPSLVAHEQTGLLFTPGDAQDALHALQRVLADPELSSGLGQAARATAAEWGWRASVECVREHYLATIDAFQARRELARPSRRLGPALLSSLILAFRGVSFATDRARRGQSPQPAAPPNLGTLLLQTQGGIHGDRSTITRA